MYFGSSHIQDMIQNVNILVIFETIQHVASSLGFIFSYFVVSWVYT